MDSWTIQVNNGSRCLRAVWPPGEGRRSIGEHVPPVLATAVVAFTHRRSPDQTNAHEKLPPNHLTESSGIITSRYQLDTRLLLTVAEHI
jgi:hypothetical protein